MRDILVAHIVSALLHFLVFFLITCAVAADQLCEELSPAPSPTPSSTCEPMTTSGYMRAVLLKQPGGPEELYIGETEKPHLKHGEVLIRVHAFSLNRADASQRKGQYPPPAGASQILGLDAAGEVVLVAPDVDSSWEGKRVMALLSGGGYAEYVAAHQGSIIEIPTSMSYVEAAAIPEAWLTAYQISHFVGHMAHDEHVLIHGGASGVGTAAIQLARLIGAHPLVTVGSAEKEAFCKKLGAVTTINYKQGDFKDAIVSYASEHKVQGVNLILDCVGGSHAVSNIESLAMDGRWVLFGQMGGATVANFPLGKILGKRIQLLGTTLRSRAQSYKTSLVKEFTERVIPAFVAGKVHVIVDKVMPWTSIVEATRMMDDNANTGKIVLQIISTDTYTKKHTYQHS